MKIDRKVIGLIERSCGELVMGTFLYSNICSYKDSTIAKIFKACGSYYIACLILDKLTPDKLIKEYNDTVVDFKKKIRGE